MNFHEEEKRTSGSEKARLGYECCQRKSSRMTFVADCVWRVGRLLRIPKDQSTRKFDGGVPQLDEISACAPGSCMQLSACMNQSIVGRSQICSATPE